MPANDDGQRVERPHIDDQGTKRGSGVRFSLKALLFLMALIAVGIGAYLSGYRNGYEGGYQHGSIEGIHWARSNPEKK